MRYTRKPTSLRDWYVSRSRPPAELLGADLVKLLDEHDRLREAANDARRRAADLADPANDTRAEKADRDAATAAARAGKPVPAPTAVPQLAEDRAAAQREAEANNAALARVVAELNTARRAEAEKRWPAESERRAKAQANIEKLAEKLAEAVTDEVREQAAVDWLRGTAAYSRLGNAQVPAVAFIPALASYKLSPRDVLTSPVAVIRAAATAALTAEEF
ncbi:hypothetical protein ACL02T_32215 [Pseudonocardia sp. RS010]|uniref:hypothetical protein n=1 Tax=Pseudonocardia sp. RS010 TaxID=3385979 RepID=UPI0039A0A7AE